MRLIIAGGGTGGHLFPAMAIAHAVKEQDPAAAVLFVGTRHGIEARILPEYGLPLRFVSTRGMRKTGFMNKVRASLELPVALVQSLGIIREFRPDFVLGVGGYASGPLVAAAVCLRVPTGIQEQNSVMGTTNRILSRFVDVIFTSWEKTEPQPPGHKTIVAGNPVRADLLNVEHQYQREPDRFKVLVFGGSRGAASINRAFTQNLDVLKPCAHQLKVVHQTGADGVRDVENAYRAAGIQAEVKDFIRDMGPAYQWADLVVCRSGASSLAEITAFGKPAIVSPYPYAIGDHQTKNARVLETAGAVRIVADRELANGALVKNVVELMKQRETLAYMASKSRLFGRPDAAQTIAEELFKAVRPRP